MILTAITACSGSGNCSPGTNNGGTIGEVALKLTAPNQYPAGMPNSITAYLTMTNTSNVNASNLYYAIPTASNYTGVAITVANDSTNPCKSIIAHQSCTFPVTIAAHANPGSFTVTATPNANTSQNALGKLISKIENKIGLLSGTLELTANIGLTNVPSNSGNGANGISFLYSNTVAASESGDTLLSIVAVVNSATAGSFNIINLTDKSGNLLNFTVSSGNSGSGATNLTQNSIVTFLLKIPASASENTFNFYAQTVDNNGSGTVNQGTIANPITVGSAAAGVLVVQPTNFSLTSPNYESQVITFTNIGNGSISNLLISAPTDPLYVINNNCNNSLAAGSSCTYLLGSHTAPGFSGNAGVTASYNNGTATASVSAQVQYAGANPAAGISITSGENPTLNFVTNTESTSTSSQLTLSNSGNVSESNFVFTVPQYFTLTAGNTGTACTLSGNTVTTILARNTSCTLTLTYTNGTTTPQQTANLLIDYKYHDIDAPQSSFPLTYRTVQVNGLLQVSSPTLPYIFPSIRANGTDESQVFVYTNIGTGTATNITVNGILQGFSTFSIVPSQPDATNDCGAGHITSLAPNAGCQVTVKFSGYTAGTYNKTLQVSYESVPSATATIISAPISGTVLPALSANMVISNVVWSPTQLGGNGTYETPFAFESSITPLIVTFTYKNDNGAYAANNFTVDISSLPQGFTLNSNGCNSVSLAINDSCNISLSYAPVTTANSSIQLDSSLQATWSDERGSVGPTTVKWDNNGTQQSQIYYQIFAVPQVTAVMSYTSDGINPITSVNAESDFYVVYTLTGGYNVSSMGYGLNLTNAQGGTPPMSVYAPNTCTLSATQPICAIKLNAGGTANNQNIDYTNTSGGTPPTPQSSGNFNVISNIPLTEYSLYLTETESGVLQCPISTDESISVCNSITQPTASYSWKPTGLAFKVIANQLYAYVVDASNNQTIWKCQVAASGSFSNCSSAVTITGGNQQQITFATINNINYVYIANIDSYITKCIVANDGTFNTCSNQAPSSAGTFEAYGINIESINSTTYAYIGNWGFGFSQPQMVCTIDINNGNLSDDCVTTSLDYVYTTTFASYNGVRYAYAARSGRNPNSSGIYQCQLNDNGTFNSCNLTPSTSPGWLYTQGIAFKTPQTPYAYVYSNDIMNTINTVYRCQLNLSNGTFSNCESQFSNSQGTNNINNATGMIIQKTN